MLGAFGRRPQVGAHFVSVTDGVSAEVGQQLLRVSADPAGLGPGGMLCCLCAADFLLCKPGGLFCLRGPCEGMVPVGPGRVYLLAGLGAGLLRWRCPGSASATALAASARPARARAASSGAAISSAAASAAEEMAAVGSVTVSIAWRSGRRYRRPD